MIRREFLQVSTAALASGRSALANEAMPMRTLGKSGLRVSLFCLGGAHMRRAGEENAIKTIHRALDLGVTFFDCAHLYNNGESDIAYGKAIGPDVRKKVVLMSKAHLYDAKSAMRQLEETLQRMRTDYLDLWQVHQVSAHKEVDQILGPGGSLETFVKAKQQGKVRHIGFTGHRDPTVHQRLLDGFDGWETVQHPVNLIDPHHNSFIENVLPRVRKRGIGLIAMKTNAMGPIRENKIATIEECLRFAMAQDVDAIVSGVETPEQLEENVRIIKTAKPMSREEVSAVLERTKKGPTGPGIERYKQMPEQRGGVWIRPHVDGETV